MHIIITIVLGITAAVLQGIAYPLYARDGKLGRSTPKSSTWGLWALLVILNCFTFRAAIEDPIVTFSFFIDVAGCIGIFTYMLALRKFLWPTGKEWRIVALAVLAMVIWYIFRDAAWANVIVFAAIVLSFWPMYKDLRKDPKTETPRAWILWTIAFLASTANVVINWKHQPLDLVMPVGAVVLHASVAYLSRASRVRRFYPNAS